MMGSVLRQEAKQPDAAIFVVPLFYAFVAAAVAWFLPLRRRKAAATEANAASNGHGT
jgi:hypothetical protein